jgi:hypothetical protein
MKYLVSDVERWGKEIDAMPAPDPGRRTVGKRKQSAAPRRRAEVAGHAPSPGLSEPLGALAHAAGRSKGQLGEP